MKPLYPELPAPPRLAEDTIRIVPLGGLGEVGRNMTVIELDGKILIVDCGVLFPEENQPGVDLILPDFTYLKDRMEDVIGVVLTHGHEDHIGAVPYLLALRGDLQIYGSRLTLSFLEPKLQERNLNRAQLIEVKEGQKLDIGPFNCEFLAVTHSIPDALAVMIRSAAGNLLVTGDYKLDQLPLDGRITDLRGFGRVGEEGIDLFLVDSTNAEVPGFVAPEKEIGPVMEQVFANATGQIIVASFASHVHRVQQVFAAAVKNGRKVCLNGRSMERNMKIAQNKGYLDCPDGLIVSSQEIMELPPQQRVFMVTGSQGEPMAALSRIANDRHQSVHLEAGDTVMLASSLIPGNENSVYRVINALMRQGAQVVHKGNAKVHVSGHACEGELLYTYNIVQPRNVMPIHGEIRHLIANGRIAVATGIDPDNVVLAESGVVVDLYRGKTKVVGKVPGEYIYVDGRSVGEIDEDQLRDRMTLGEEGFVSVFAVVDTESKLLIAGPHITVRGMAEDEKVFNEVLPDVTEALEHVLHQGEQDTYRLQQVMRRALGRWVARKLRRQPMIVPVVVDIQ